MKWRLLILTGYTIVSTAIKLDLPWLTPAYQEAFVSYSTYLNLSSVDSRFEWCETLIKVS